MDMDTTQVAVRFCEAITQHPNHIVDNSTVKIAVWLIGAAARTGGFPIELSFKQIRVGFERNGVTVEGTGCRHETVTKSVAWLKGHGFLRLEVGKPTTFGSHANIYTMLVQPS